MEVNLRKIGNFYHVFDDDAYIMHYFFNYKIINKKAGFPISALSKIINTLDEHKINYIIDSTKKDYKKQNKYNYYKNKGIKKYENKLIKDDVLNKIDELKERDKEKLLKLIQNFVVNHI